MSAAPPVKALSTETGVNVIIEPFIVGPGNPQKITIKHVPLDVESVSLEVRPQAGGPAIPSNPALTLIETGESYKRYEGTFSLSPNTAYTAHAEAVLGESSSTDDKEFTTTGGGGPPPPPGGGS